MACTAHDTMHKQVNKMSYALFQGSGVHEHDLPGRAFEQRQLFASSFVRCCSLFRTTKCRTTKTQLKTAVITINRTKVKSRVFSFSAGLKTHSGVALQTEARDSKRIIRRACCASTNKRMQGR
jgi:hypothetical protein